LKKHFKKLLNFVATNGPDYSNTEHQKEAYLHLIYLGERDCESADTASEEQLASEFLEFAESRFS
jgi:hypothetical protein